MKKAAIALPILLVLALAGCGDDGTPGSDPTDAGGSGGTGGGNASCLVGPTWNLDINDVAAQLGQQLSSKGLNVVSTSGDGSESFTFNADGSVSSHIDVTYEITVDMDSGLTMTIDQKHTGDPGGDYSLDGSTVSFANWDASGYNVKTSIAINGTASDTQIPMDSADLGDTDMVVECTSSGLTSTIAGAPFEWHWTN